MKLHTFEVEKIESFLESNKTICRNLALKKGICRILELLKESAVSCKYGVPAVLTTFSGSYLRLRVLGINEDEILATEGPGSFVVYKYKAIKGIYPAISRVKG